MITTTAALSSLIETGIETSLNFLLLIHLLTPIWPSAL